MLHSRNAVAIPPGATIHEQLDHRGMSQKEFAVRMDLSEKHISHLINGKVELTKDVALRLESVLGLSASFWNNLEVLYREQEARVNAELARERDEEAARKFPYAKMAAIGWIPAAKEIGEKVDHLRAYFEVARLDLLETLCIPGVAYRKVGSNTTSDYTLAAWSQKARLEARKIQTKPINIKRLQESLTAIRAMTRRKPEPFCEDLRCLLAECGVGIVFLPHIGGSFLHGVSFVDGNHIVIGLSVRGKYADKFWFSLFHELGHVLAGHINELCCTSEEQEQQADEFARNTLISPIDYDDFVRRNDMSYTSIQSFAQAIDIDPGIVLGRLQKDNLVAYNHFNDLKTQYRIDG